MTRSRLTRLLLATLILSIAAPVVADEEIAPYPYVVAAGGGRYYLKLVPQRGTRDVGNGAVYSVSRSGPDQVVYRTTGWFAFQTFLSYNGEQIVRIGNWPRGHRPSSAHLAIAFYTRGKLVKQYSTAELIKDPSKVQPTVSHYSFLRKLIGFEHSYSTRFSLISVDGIRYTFDARTGKILESKPVHK